MVAETPLDVVDSSDVVGSGKKVEERSSPACRTPNLLSLGGDCGGEIGLRTCLLPTTQHVISYYIIYIVEVPM